jgi:hypothetical protein
MLLAVNVVYAALRWMHMGTTTFTWTDLLGLATCVGLQVYAYIGILENATNRSSNDKNLVGGAALDILCLTVLIQFGGFWSPKCFWMFLVFPSWCAYSLYQTFSIGSSKKAPGTEVGENKQTEEKRQMKAERRRQTAR